MHYLTVHNHDREERNAKKVQLPSIRIHFHQCRGRNKEYEHDDKRANHTQLQWHPVANECVQNEEQGVWDGRSDAKIRCESSLDGR